MLPRQLMPYMMSTTGSAKGKINRTEYGVTATENKSSPLCSKFQRLIHLCMKKFMTQMADPFRL